jgi:type IV pilus biogenesis protein CpaD/CtpE
MKRTLLTLASFLALSACNYATEAQPDHRVGLITNPSTGKLEAISRPCATWHQYIGDGLENHEHENFGCSDGYNLSKMIDQPSDLVAGRVPGSAEASTGVLGVERYRQDKTKKLINPKEIPTTN